MFKRLALATCSFMLFNSTVYASQLYTYEEIASSLEAGTPVLINIKPEKCVQDPMPPNDEKSDRLVVKIPELYEWHSIMNGGKKMKVLGYQVGGIYGDKKFDYFRSITDVYEDGTVMVLADHVDPKTFDLTRRDKIICHLTVDGSGGVMVKQLPA